LKNNNNPSFFALLKNYAFPLWRGLLVAVIISLIATIFTSIQPLLVSGLLEFVIGSNFLVESEVVEPSIGFQSFFDLNTIGVRVKEFFQSYSNSENNNFELVIITLMFFLVIAFLASLFNYFSQIASNWLRVESSRLIRKDIARHLLSLNLAFFHNQKSGEIVSRFTQDATNTANGLGPLLNGFIIHGMLIIFYSFYLFSTDPLLTIAALSIILLQWVVTKLLKKPVRIRERNYYDKLANVVNTMHEALTSIRIIKSFGADNYEIKKFDKDINVVRDAEFNSGLITAIETHARAFFDNFAIAGIFVVGFIQLKNDSLTVQGFILFLFIGRLIISPINKFAVNFVWMQALLASYDRLHEIFQTKNDVIDGENVVDSFKKNLVFENVSFSYGQIEVLSNISFELSKGEVLAIVGPSGSGKSTLTDLILRLVDPQEGAIFVDDINLKTLRSIDYRKNFGVVAQESLLFNDTITNNICFGREFTNQEQIETVAKIANAHEFIVSLEQGYKTIVGDRGVKLSGGQRQRISIARAIYSKPEIVIFDEATSSLDSHSEKQVQIAIEKILSKSTAIIVAHRLSTILHADKIIVLSKGKIEAIGSHQELLERSETYLKLYTLQFNG
jgi:ATP-binding cassette, subfamily B, bacterial MsbA